MEFTEEFVAEHKLTPEQVTAVKTFGTDHVANERKAWDDKLKTDGNQYAEGILNGVVAPIEKETGIKRGDGEKTADFLKRATGSHLATKQAEVDTLKAEYAEKIKNGGTDAAMKEELTKAKAEVDRLKQIEAEYEPIKGVKEQYETLQKEYGTLKLETAFGKARPSFPETVNAYEADAKWNTFKNGILTKYNIEIVDGDPIAIDKENEHKRYKLSELAAQDKDLAELTKGRHQPGSGTTIKDAVDIEGVPFKVPANATSEERSKAIRDYLINDKKVDPLSGQFTEEFEGYLKKILGVKK